jgi:LytS/YehU family sensor histidine kinase
MRFVAEWPRYPRATGLGLANVGARLRAAYGADASLIRERIANSFHVTVTLPAETH